MASDLMKQTVSISYAEVFSLEERRTRGIEDKLGRQSKLVRDSERFARMV